MTSVEPKQALDLSHPPDVLPVLQVSAIGHRNLVSADIAALSAAARAALGRIEEAARLAMQASSVQRRRGVELRCICALAEGADLLFAQAALDLNYSLSAALPFHREIYRDDFASPEAKSAYDRLLGQAISVYELDGVYGDELAYRTVGRLLIEQSDIMLAIWDGRPERGPGGTGEVIREARNAGVPVIAISPNAPYAVSVFVAGAKEGVSTVEAIVEHILVHTAKNSAVPLQLYLAEDLQRRRRAPDLLRHLENALLLVGGKGAAQREERSPPAAGAEFSHRSGQAIALLAEVDRRFGPHYDAANALAIRYAALYRTSALLRYLSVLPATIAAFYAFEGTPFESRLGFLAQLLVLAGTLLIYYFDEHGQWHRRFLDYRFLAETLRQSRLVALFGSTAALPRLPPHLVSTASDWVNWRLHAVIRSLGLVSARVDPPFLDSVRADIYAELKSQIGYYERRGLQFGALSHILRRFGVYLFAAGLVFTVVREIMAVFGLSGASYKMSAELALFIPAFAPIFLGIRSQNEYERLSQRYTSMSREFRRIQQTLTAGILDRTQLEGVARSMVSVMQGEVSDWRVLIKARSIDPY